MAQEEVGRLRPDGKAVSFEKASLAKKKSPTRLKITPGSRIAGTTTSRFRLPQGNTRFPMDRKRKTRSRIDQETGRP